MQLGAALALFGALERLAKPKVPATSPPNRIWITVFAASLIVLSGSSLLGMIWAAAAIAAFLGIQNRDQPLGFLREHFGLWLMTGLLLAGLTAYYGWTIRAGSRATPGITDWRNLLFAAFELLGFTGLGPGRLELRNVGVSAVRAYLLPLAAIASLWALVAFAGFRHSRKELLSRLGRYLFLVIAGTITLLVVIGLLKHFRLLGAAFYTRSAGRVLGPRPRNLGAVADPKVNSTDDRGSFFNSQRRLLSFPATGGAAWEGRLPRHGGGRPDSAAVRTDSLVECRPGRRQVLWRSHPGHYRDICTGLGSRAVECFEGSIDGLTRA